MILDVMAIKDRTGKVDLFKTKNAEATNFKDKFVKVYFLDEGDRKYVSELLTPLLSEERKSVFAKINIDENTNEVGEKNNSYWTSKKTEKFNERFFIVKLNEIALIEKKA